jgi:phosphate transport system substrate-binding protein
MIFKLQVQFKFAWMSTIAAVALAGCAGETTTTTQPDATAQPSPVTQEVVDANAPKTAGILIDGSSTVYPVTEAAAKQFRETSEGQTAQMDVKFSGTSAGFRQFCAAETDISNASRPILLAEIEACNKAGVRFIELPIAFDALTLAVNPQNNWAQDLTIAELKKIWEPAAQGKVNNWSQVRQGYPNRPLKLFGAGKNSGTFDYFNEVTTGDPKQSRTDYTSSEDDNVLVEGIAKDPNALGYIPFFYFEQNENRLKALAIDSGKGPVAPSRQMVENAKYQPFSRPLFIYVNARSAQSKPEVRAFVDYYLKNANKIVTSVNYIPLPEEGYHLAKVQFNRGEIGTVFEGVPQPDVTIAELLRRQAVFQLSSQPQTGGTDSPQSTAPK